MNTSRRKFLQSTVLGTAGIMLSPNLSARSYGRVKGANDRLNVAIVGLGRRLGAFTGSLPKEKNNVNISYLCDVMPHQLEGAAEKFSELIDYKPKLESDIRKVLEDKELDAVFNATPDHWHTPGALMAMKAGKHVYVEKPCSHNMYENEIIVEAARKYNKVVQMGNQQRSSPPSQEVMKKIHDGAIGKPYRAVAFYTSERGRVPNQKPAEIPGGLDWELFQGPAPRRAYTSETWNYNWHWYGWDYGTAEAGNNGTHEIDVARWALQVEYPERVDVDAGKGHFLDDGWEMYDNMYAIFKFDGNKSIAWDGRSRNKYDTYGAGRGTIIYGSEGSVFVDRNKYILYDRNGNKVSDFESDVKESGVALGGGGGATNNHIANFLNTIRGTDQLNAPIDDSAISQAMVHYANAAYRINRGFDVDDDGRMLDRKAMTLWSREYEKGWEVKL